VRPTSREEEDVNRIETSLLLSTVALSGVLLLGCNEHRSARVEAEPARSACAPVAAPAAQAPQPSTPPSASATIAATPTSPKTVAPVADAPKASKRKLASTEKLRIKRLVVSEGVANREPVDIESSFSAKRTDRIYAFVEVENPAQEKDEIVVEFDPPGGGDPRGNVTLNVGAAQRWRTWAFTREVKTTGEWTAVVKTRDGQIIATAPFTVTS
jgi:hypothetical protein